MESNALMPYMPRFETVNVPSCRSAGVLDDVRTRSISAAVSRAISPSERRSASRTTGTSSAPGRATAMPMLTRS